MKDFFDDWDSGAQWPKPAKPRHKVVKCYESHPQLQLGGGIFIGGSCGHPVRDDADVYIGLESGMRHQSAKYPWAAADSGPVGVSFLINDMGAPKDVPNFLAMIRWLAEQLAAGKTVHVGCVGGHGRTGLVLSALVKYVTGNADAITWVRANYCNRAVESASQVEFLHQHFGIVKVEGTKSYDKLSYGGKGDVVTGVVPPRYHQDNFLPKERAGSGDLIPGTKMPRSRGPRNVASVESGGPLPTPKRAQKPDVSKASPDPEARQNMWQRFISNLTNANE
jgi:hypothetical protein